jgi:tetratricopeptide (TPR) repeat protein
MKKLMTLVLALVLLSGCRKDFLDEKPNKALLVPTNLADFQALLDNTAVMNVVPGMQRLATDDLFTTYAGWQAYDSPEERNSYVWAADIYQGEPSIDWSTCYQQVFYSNIVLDGLVKLPAGRDNEKLRASALFYRAVAFYHLAQIYTKPYDPATAGQDPGIPLPLVADVNQRPGRGTVQQVYDQIINDLLSSISLLPETAEFKSRPAVPAALAFLARVYLTMGDYAKAQTYATRCLDKKSALLDYNSYNAASSTPFPTALPNGNDEVLFYSSCLLYAFNYSGVTGINPEVIRSYAPNDLRKDLFFRNTTTAYAGLKNNYGAPAGTFGGIATNEVYLIRAECRARNGDNPGALADLNTLLVKRFKTGTFVPVTGTDVLKTILAERRKELFSNVGILRWVDLRRLNREPDFAVTLQRVLNGVTYTLPPNDKRYVYPLPPNEIANNDLQQNER